MKDKNIPMSMMLTYLQEGLDRLRFDIGKYGMNDKHVQKDMDRLLACKEMTEILCGVPVNLQLNGKVTIGF